MKINFVTFADLRYKPTLERMKDEAKAMGVFNSIYVLCEDDFDEEYSNLFYSQKRNKLYAFGYYCWKSYAIKKTLDLSNEDDVIVYCDAGCTLNAKESERIRSWAKILDNDKDIICFIQNMYIESDYTKEDLFRYFDIDDKNEYRNSPQFFAGALIIRKTKTSVELINKWFHLSNDNLILINETSQASNKEGFIAPRYDQSILSLLLKQYERKIFFDYSLMIDEKIKGTQPIYFGRKTKYSLKAYL